MHNIKITIRLVLIVLILSVFWYIEKTENIPEYGNVFYQLALECNENCTQSKQQDYLEKAINHFVLSNEPLKNIELSDAHFRLGIIYETQKRREKALKSYVLATETYGGNYAAHFHAGRIFYEDGRFEQAMKHFLKTFKPGTGYPSEANFYLGHLYDQKKNYNSAIDHFLNVLPQQRAEISRRLVQLYYLVEVKYGPKARDQGIHIIIKNLREYNNHTFADLLEHHLAEFEGSGQ